ncbi:MAG TPA: nucleoside recognition domain-containing protein [Bacteroidota bacterium]|nr:nucleoside recognition domain-containing protein [Bacteroidota bacterium]
MLNYIWLALIAIGVLTAVGIDVRNEIVNPYRNGEILEGEFVPVKQPGALRSEWEGTLVIEGNAFRSFYHTAALVDTVKQMSVLDTTRNTAQLTLVLDGSSPQVWQEMGKSATTVNKLEATLRGIQWADGHTSAHLKFVLEPIRFVRLRAVTQAAFEYAGVAVTIAIGLIGVMAFWLGIMSVAEEAGILKIIARLLAPVMRRLFPDVPSDHPAISAMIMNIAANMLGLSNAATPLGLKAMEELDKLNPKAGTATNAMVTFLAINTGGLILIPATALAVRSAAGSTNPGIIIGTSIVGAGCATLAGIAASKILERLPRYRRAMEVPHE